MPVLIQSTDLVCTLQAFSDKEECCIMPVVWGGLVACRLTSGQECTPGSRYVYRGGLRAQMGNDCDYWVTWPMLLVCLVCKRGVCPVGYCLSKVTSQETKRKGWYRWWYWLRSRQVYSHQTKHSIHHDEGHDHAMRARAEMEASLSPSHSHFPHV